ncbi:pyridine nucleotide-disulfide oxidoreductase [Candidatus Atribacteria bacterium RBG_19FT_COMBO_35_14]|uniref:Pyridine nucleotide-disulfide oxidoreductase n=2 Tax=root TaxID=1 RepID=A0A1F5A5A8_9BACT|nr:MAG: pyridine nucleotide-disulfide oxidoreductase [Candidatus Atribacteria bacterium RBG_19FT_COMBO_35_14]
MKLEYDLVIIGGGPAGLAVALEARRNTVKDILLLERDKYLGGILPQCIHNGFGVQYFKEELTGPEYAGRFITKLKDCQINVKKETMVINITSDKRIIAINRDDGLLHIQSKAVVLAMGCRERTREAIAVPGSRPAGIFTAGTAQRYINIEGYMPGREVVVLGSGDIGMIMARRMTLEGARVKAVLEIMPFSTGLIRNKVQCLDDFNIPLKFNHTITRIEGGKRVEKVTVAQVDKNLQAIPGTEEEISCDTVLLSVGLIPENELTSEAGIKLDPVTRGPIVNENRETEIEGIFACGNVLHVHDLADFVTEEGEIVGRAVGEYLKGNRKFRSQPIKIFPGDNIAYVVPQHIDFIVPGRKKIKLFMRVKKPEERVKINLIDDKGRVLTAYKKRIVTPGEMVSVFLPEVLLDDKLKNITISIKRD